MAPPPEEQTDRHAPVFLSAQVPNTECKWITPGRLVIGEEQARAGTKGPRQAPPPHPPSWDTLYCGRQMEVSAEVSVLPMRLRKTVLPLSRAPASRVGHAHQAGWLYKSWTE